MGTKWEVRIAGPDDVLTFDSEIEARRYAKAINGAAARANASLHMEGRVLCHATVHRVEDERALGSAAGRENEARLAHLVSEDCHAGSCRVYLASDELPIRDMYDTDILRVIDEDAARSAGGEG